MVYWHVAVLSTETIEQRLNTGVGEYREQASSQPDRIELGDCEIHELEEHCGGIRSCLWHGVRIRPVESPSYLAVVGECLTVLVYPMLN